MDNFRKMQLANANFKKSEKNYNENRDRDKLINTLTKRIQTSFIGAISACEDHLGYLWGIDEENPTPQHDKFLKLWNKVRAIILDNGNDQIRALRKDLKNYTVNYNKTKTLPIKGDGIYG